MMTIVTHLKWWEREIGDRDEEREGQGQRQGDREAESRREGERKGEQER